MSITDQKQKKAKTVKGPSTKKPATNKPDERQKPAERRVVLGKHVPPSKGHKSGRRQLFAFSWVDIGILLGVSPEEAQDLARPAFKYTYYEAPCMGLEQIKKKEKVRGSLFDPKDLESIHKFVESRRWTNCDRGADVFSEPDYQVKYRVQAIYEYISQYNPEYLSTMETVTDAVEMCRSRGQHAKYQHELAEKVISELGEKFSKIPNFEDTWQQCVQLLRSRPDLADLVEKLLTYETQKIDNANDYREPWPPGLHKCAGSYRDDSLDNAGIKTCTQTKGCRLMDCPQTSKYFNHVRAPGKSRFGHEVDVAVDLCKQILL